MKLFLSLGIALCFASLSTAAQPTKINGIDHYFETVPTTEKTLEQIKKLKFENRQDDIDGSNFNLWDVVNLAEKAWGIVQDNRPRVNVQYTYANALPEAVRNGLELEDFSDVQTKTFRQFGKSGFGGTVYDFRYAVVHRYNGNYQGTGRYLENISIIPLTVNANWGYNIDVDIKNVSTANIGSRTKPVAALTMDMRFAVNTVLKHTEINHSFIFRGDQAEVRVIK